MTSLRTSNLLAAAAVGAKAQLDANIILLNHWYYNDKIKICSLSPFWRCADKIVKIEFPFTPAPSRMMSSCGCRLTLNSRTEQWFIQFIPQFPLPHCQSALSHSISGTILNSTLSTGRQGQFAARNSAVIVGVGWTNFSNLLFCKKKNKSVQTFPINFPCSAATDLYYL